jgi:hypothetical protein
VDLVNKIEDFLSTHKGQVAIKEIKQHVLGSEGNGGEFFRDALLKVKSATVDWADQIVKINPPS